MDYARQKLREAVDCLVTPYPFEDRMSSAALALTGLTSSQVPELIADDLGAVMQLLTKHPAEIEGEGTIRASVRNLTAEEGKAISLKLVSLYSRLLRPV